MSISLRSVRPDDEAFLFKVYASTRIDEFATQGGDDDPEGSLLKMQFAVQQQHYHARFPRADYQIVQLNSEPIGRLIVMRWDDEILIVDIALLPDFRNAGIGTTLIKGLFAEAKQTSKPIRLHVEKFNRALRLYKRLGFSKIDDIETHFLMEWHPDSASD